MITHRTALIVLPLILVGLLPGCSPDPGSATWQQEPTLPPPEVESPATTSYVMYLPFVENHEPVAAPLRNGDFEADWSEESSHACLIFRTDGGIESTIRGNIFTPPGWVVWFKHGLPVEHAPDNLIGWSQPEVRDARATSPDRMHTGTKGQLLFTFWRVHDAGFLQQVAAVPGQRLQLSGWAHAWSNLGEYSECEIKSDPRWSEGYNVGYNHFFALEGTPQLSEADRNFTFWLGIDPTGGINPFADTVVWGQGAHIYNAYREVPPATAVAEAETVTVFLRSRTLWTYQHNDAYWDDITLDILR
jgi:hypothetical protein